MLEKRKKGFMVGFPEEVETDRKVGFLVNHVKMIRKEQNLVEEKTLQKEQSKDAAQHVLLVKLIKEERVTKVKGEDYATTLRKRAKKAGKAGRKPRG